MSQGNIEDATPIPDYELEQRFPERHDLSEDDRERLRDEHGRIRTYFLLNPSGFKDLQRWLNQARMGYTYDIYLERIVGYTLIAAAVGLILGTALSLQLFIFGGWQSLGVSSVALQGGLTVLLILVSVGLFAGGAFVTGYYYPLMRASTRERQIDILLPHAIVYMYALSHGGMNSFEVLKELAEAEDVYGEVAQEFDVVVRDVELFGNDLFSALRDARSVTPSENLEQFIDDMISVLDSGSDFSTFLEDEAGTYMDQARDEQEGFLDTLSILSEIFIVAFVAAPLFLIVTLMVITLLGGDALLQAFFLVYVGLPLGMLGFLAAVDILAKPYAESTETLEIERSEFRTEWSNQVQADPDYEEYEDRKKRDERRAKLENPIQQIRERNPLLSLALTVPVALLCLGGLVVSGAVPTSLEGLFDAPVQGTLGLFVVPFLVVTVPLAGLYESQRRRKRSIAKRFPDTLNILSSANQMGIRLVEALNLVSRWSEGALADELRKVRNDIAWNEDVERALLEFANRLRVPQVTRTMKLIAKGNRSSSNLSQIISIAAEDTRNRYQIERKRRSEMGAYTAIVVIGFLVFLAVIVMLDTSYLTPISNLSGTTGEVGGEAAPGGVAGVASVGDVPVGVYRAVFLHSALIQGIGSGLLAGKLAENNVLAGLKYSIGLVTITAIVFLVI
ncbi:type II secretion system F family protein [Natronomonas marina]|jgi:flagellar protein FlaJ|uniref:type II secretion system F family protein n=1 Tax=Natronomonas marina TaxID=2961939 RepID=UPI0020C95BA5|nr:type II secretion system F family protein [Natronomonas marina]